MLLFQDTYYENSNCSLGTNYSHKFIHIHSLTIRMLQKILFIITYRPTYNGHISKARDRMDVYCLTMSYNGHKLKH